MAVMCVAFSIIFLFYSKALLSFGLGIIKIIKH